ncbi:MAG: hypothetical protein ACK40E_05315, partial [Caldimicrobium sp.]
MKVGRWKVLALAGVLSLGYVATTEAAQIKVSDETWANFGVYMKIWYKNLAKRSNSTSSGGWSQNEFSVGPVLLDVVGQITKQFQFYTSTRFMPDANKTNTIEAGVNLPFAKEFQVLAGLVRKPFTRYSIVSGFAQVVPTDYFLDPQGMVKTKGAFV